ncbi:hypothetical protein V8F33_011877 [Rhypophila sp. PSN 637]
MAEEDRALVTLARECSRLSNDIREELQRLRPKRRKSKARSGLAALKTLMVEPKIKDLETQLQRCRDQLHFHISSLSSENLKRLVVRCKEDGAKLTRLELAITQLRQTLQNMTTMRDESTSDQILIQLNTLLHIGQDALDEVVQDRILRGIKDGFDEMSYRYQSVDKPFKETFEWIFDLGGKSPEATKFTQWLSSGDGIFHICGKLGSGKSTLMKKLYTHRRTRLELEKWMNPRQKSLMGLHRTLLYQILRVSPGLMKFLLPDQWTNALAQPKVLSAVDIPDDEIQCAFERLAKQHDRETLGGCCFSIFIDGLDEYQTTTSIDRRKMVHALKDLANSACGSFKICVSSRMENPFMDMFSEDIRLYLHELTRADMEEYVHGNLEHVGTQNERRRLATSITAKAEGVFLWVVLVVLNIRKLWDDGARFSRLLTEIQSLPTELNELFQRILDTLGSQQKQMASHTITLLLFLGKIRQAKKMHIWLNLSDFYFLEDYVSNPRFAESGEFPAQDCESVKESENRARRQLRGVCRGLVEANIDKELEFTHRSVRDFFRQKKVRVKMHDKSFKNLEALCQLKLASIRQYWLDTQRQNGSKDVEVLKEEEKTLSRHSELVACLLERRRQQQLDQPPFAFLLSLDAIPQLSVSAMIGRACISNKTTFRINHSWTKSHQYQTKNRRDGFGFLGSSGYEICHSSRVRHISIDVTHGMPEECVDESTYWRQKDNKPDTENSAVSWRPYDEPVDILEDYSTAVISPLLTLLCSGRLEYPFWRISRLEEMPLESDALVMLAYSSIATGIDPSWYRESEVTEDALKVAGLGFVEHIFKHQILSPNFPTHLAFGAKHGLVRVAVGNQRLSLWQHFLCWWAAIAAASGDFEEEDNPGSSDWQVEPPEGDTISDNEQPETGLGLDSASEDTSLPDSYPQRDPSEQNEVGSVLECFIRNGADVHLALKIEDGRKVTGEDDEWLAYFMQITLHGGKPMELEVVVNLETRLMFGHYPYGPVIQRRDETFRSRKARPRQPLPSSALSVRDWIDRSRLPNRHALLKLIYEKLGVAEPATMLVSDESHDK